jgi:hypothetical protein
MTLDQAFGAGLTADGVEAACAAAIAATPVTVDANTDKTGYSLAGSNGANGPSAGIAATDIHVDVFEGGTSALYARVFKDGVDIKQADITSIVYNLYQLDPLDRNARAGVEGHNNVSLAAVDVVFDAVRTDLAASNYNFRHTPAIDTHPAFRQAGRQYLAEYTIVPTLGQRIIVRFKITVI